MIVSLEPMEWKQAVFSWLFWA